MGEGHDGRATSRLLGLGLGLICLLGGLVPSATAHEDDQPTGPGAGSGRVIVWGGPADRQAVLTPPEDLVDVVAVATSDTPGSYSNLAVRADGTVVGWGLNVFGEADLPAGLADVTSVDIGAGFGVALQSNGNVTAWGSNQSGQLQVPQDLGPVIAISAGGYRGYRGLNLREDVCGFGLAVRADGTVARWGADTAELACDLIDERMDPPAGLADVVAVSAGARSALALRADGTVVAWGSGVGAGMDGTPPGLWSDVVAVAAGNGHLLGLQSDGSVLAYGIWGETGPPQESGVTAIAAANLDLFLHSDGSVTAHRGEAPPLEPAARYLAVAAGFDYGVAIVADQPRPRDPLLGTSQVQPWTDENPAGMAEAFRYTADRSGRATRFHLYVDGESEATAVVVGVYADIDGEPGLLLASGRSYEPVPGSWNVVSLPGLEVGDGQHYWLALLAPEGSGVLRFRDLPDGEGGPTRVSAQQHLGLDRGLPRLWRTGQKYGNAPASLFLS